MDDLDVIDFYDVDDIEINTIKDDTFNNIVDVMKNYDLMKLNYKSSNRMTNVEKTKILGIRAQQLACGALSIVKFPPYLTDHLERAEYELNQKKTPFIIKRLVADKYEYWKIEDLIIV